MDETRDHQRTAGVELGFRPLAGKGRGGSRAQGGDGAVPDQQVATQHGARGVHTHQGPGADEKRAQLIASLPRGEPAVRAGAVSAPRVSPA